MQQDAEAAISSYLRVLDDDVGNAMALDALKRLYRAEERWIDLVELLIRKLDFCDTDEDRIETKFELAQVYEAELKEDMQAIQCYRDILDLAPVHEKTIEALEVLFEDEREQLAIAEMLEPIYRELESWEKLIGVIEVLLTNIYDEFERGERLSEILKLWEIRLERQDKAFESAGRLFLERPQSEEACSELRRLALSLDEVERWAELYREALSGEKLYDFSDKRPVLMVLAEIVSERLGDFESAQALYEEVLLEDPTDAAALDRLEWGYNQRGDWAALIALYRRRVELSADPSVRIELLLKIALINEEILEAIDDSIEAYGQVLDIEFEDERAISALERLYRQVGQFEELAELYRRQLDFTEEGEERVALLHRLGMVQDQELDRVPEAIDSYRSAIELDSSHPGTRRSLEALLHSLGERDEELRHYRHQIATILEPLYDESQWHRLVQVYEVQLEQLDDPFSQVEIMVKQARLLEAHEPDRKLAFDAYARAFKVSPSAAEIRQELERLAQELTLWQELVEIYQSSVDSCDDEFELISILMRIAQLFEKELGQESEAIAHYRRVLERDPSYREALDALERLYLQAEAFKELVEVLVAKAEAISDIWERKDLYYRIADIWEEMLESPQEAIQTYRSILDIDDEDQTALDALERLFKRTEGWVDLIDVLRRKIVLAEDSTERKGLFHQIAILYDEQLDDSSEAIEVYRSVLGEDPNDAEAILALDRLFNAQERWIDLLDILHTELDIANEHGDEEAVNAIELRIGLLLEEHLDDSMRALTHYEAILQRTPEHGEALARLEAMLREPAYQEAATEILRPLYESLGRWGSLVELYSMRLADLQDPFDRKELALKIAGLYEEELEQPQAAFEFLARVAVDGVEDEALLEEYGRLAAQLEAWAEFVKTYEELLEKGTDPNFSLKLCMKAAQTYENYLEDPQSAIAKYARVVEIDEYHGDALASLDRLYQQTENWEALISILERRIEVSSEPSERLLFRFQIGYLNEQVFEKLPEAIDQYKQIIWDEPKHEDALESLERLVQHVEHRFEIAEVLEPLYRQWEAWQKLYELLVLKLEVLEDDFDKMTLLRQLGSIAEEKLSDLPQAFAAYASALSFASDDAGLIQQLERLAEVIENWSDLAEALESVRKEIDDDFNRLQITLKLALLYVDKLGQLEAAEGCFKEVIEADPEQSEALVQLERIYQALERPLDLLSVFEQRIEYSYDLPERKELLYRCADVALNTLQDDERGIGYLEQILEVDDTEATALDALESLLESKERWDDLIGVLERKVSLALEADDILRIRLRIGAIAAEKLEDFDRAIMAFHNALDFDPTNREILATLEDLLVSAERWSNVRDIIMRRLSVADEDEERLMLHIKLAAIAEAKFNDTERAVENLQQVLMIDPSNDDALGELERIFSAEGRFNDLLSILNQQKEQTTEPEDLISLNVRIAQVAGSHLGDKKTAIESLNHVLEIQPTNYQALAVLAKLYEEEGDYPKALELLNTQLGSATDAVAASDVLVRIAQVLEAGQGESEQIEEAFVEALKQNPQNLTAIESLLEIYSARQDHTSRLRILEYKVAALNEPEERRQLLLEIANTAKNELGDFETAARTLEQLYAADTSDLETAEQLLDAYIQSDNQAKAHPLLDALIGGLKEKKLNKKLPPFYHMAGQMAEKAGDSAKALESYQAARAINANYMPNLHSLGLLFFKEQDLEEALKIFQTMLLHQMNIKDKSIKISIFYHLGMVHMQKGDDRRAKGMFNRALSLDANHEPSKTALAEL